MLYPEKSTVSAYAPLFTQEVSSPDCLGSAETLNQPLIRSPVSSAVEHSRHMRRVGGSKPSPGTAAARSKSFKLGQGWGASYLHFDELNTGDHAPHGLYVMRVGPYYKIGIPDRPLNRLENLRGASPFAIRLVMVRTIIRFYARQYEKSVHAKLAPFHHRGEWFSADLPTIKQAIDATRPEALRWIRERAALMRR